MWTVMAILVLAFAVTAVILIWDGRLKNPEEAPDVTITDAGANGTGAMQGTDESEYPPLVIETPYCDLYYPGQWADSLRVEITGTEPEAIVSFYGTVAQEEQLLFRLYFCGAEGFPVGAIETENGMMMDVTVEIAELTLKDSWSDEETDRICAMQEGMNTVMDGLKKLPNFTPAE